MTSETISETFDDDLHLLMAIAVLSGQKGVAADLLPVYETWSAYYPNDALGGLGRGLHMIGTGEVQAGFELIQSVAQTASSRADQARDVLSSLHRDFSKPAE